MEVVLNKEKFVVEIDEYTQLGHHTYNNLKIVDKLGEHERLISFLTEITNIYKFKPDLMFVNTTHGGYVPIKCASKYFLVYTYANSSATIEFINVNASRYSIDNISINTPRNSHKNYVMFLNGDINTFLGVKEAIEKDNILVVTSNILTNINFNFSF